MAAGPNETPLREQLAPRDRQDLIETARALAEAASQAVRPHFRASTLSADNKKGPGDFDPVTQGDRAVETALRAVLAERRPLDAVLGEEYGAQDGTSGITWVLDPIDGTRGFLIGAPTWGTLIAACDAAGPFLGVIAQPYTKELWIGGLGLAALETALGTTPLCTRATTDLAEVRLCSTFPEIGTPAERAAFQAVAREVLLVRYGLDCYAYGLLAAGHVDLVIEAGLHSYDICGPAAVIAAAGGVVTTWEGTAPHHGGQILAAANAELHAIALERLHAAMA